MMNHVWHSDLDSLIPTLNGDDLHMLLDLPSTRDDIGKKAFSAYAPPKNK
jgi:hypothetical protein